jgi:glycosyltransferase involved in cell wall biosynthesis
MKAILVSKRFNPGHVSHMEANAKLLEAHGFDVRFNVHKNFLSFPDCAMKGNETGFLNSFLLCKSDLFIIWFPSISVLFEIFFVKIFTRATTVYIYHEPYTSFSSYRSAGFSWIKVVRVAAISVVSLTICALCDKIILPSTRAFVALPKAKDDLRRYAKINLMFADETGSQTQGLTREFVSYIGTIAEDHAFDEFVRTMQICISDRKLLPYKFLIATRSELPELHRDAINQGVSSGRLVIQSGSPMTNSQINRYFAQSFVVWNAYKRSMQSGVLPKAYMFGTPVLVSSSNQNEYFQDSVHGALISAHYTVGEFEQAIAHLQKNWLVISQNCRNYYLQNFDYRALSTKFMSFVSDLT